MDEITEKLVSGPGVTEMRASRPPVTILLAPAVLVGLYATSLHSYLLFHALAEMFSVVVACSIFVLAWNTRRFLDNACLLILGIAYLFVGGIDLLHTLAYKGMGVFPRRGADLPTQLWIAARYLEAVSLLIAPCLLSRKLNAGAVRGKGEVRTATSSREALVLHEIMAMAYLSSHERREVRPKDLDRSAPIFIKP